MKEKIRLIKTEIDDIGLLLYSGFESGSDDFHEATTEEWQLWQQRGANLEERTKKLTEKIDDLKEFSTTAYWYAQTLDTQVVTEAELVRLLDRKNWIDELSKSLTKLCEECDSVHDIWSLVLSAPDEEGGLSSVEDQTDILIEFDVFRMIQTEPNFRPIGILPLRGSQLKQRTMSELIEQVHQNTNLVILTRWSKTLKELLAKDSPEFSRVL